MKEDQIAVALNNIALQIKNLGHGDATNDKFGAIEGLAMVIKDSNESISSALDSVATAINNVANAIGNLSLQNTPDPD